MKKLTLKDRVLLIAAANAITAGAIARALDTPDGSVRRMLSELKQDKLVKRVRETGMWEGTEKGRETAKELATQFGLAQAIDETPHTPTEAEMADLGRPADSADTDFDGDANADLEAVDRDLSEGEDAAVDGELTHDLEVEVEPADETPVE